MIITTVSDNKNRTAQEVRHVFSKYNGNMAEAGAVSWNFEKKGIMNINKSEISDAEEFMLTAIECGAEDIDDTSDPVEVRTAPEDMMSVADALKEAGFTPRDVEFAHIPKTTVAVEGREAEKILNLISKIEDLDDVQNVYANFNISDEEMERIMEAL
jgi:YebC/PmpR family DNA-binding regulatory protein